MTDALNFLCQNIGKNQTVVIAVSGGPDSMALLHLVNRLKEEKHLKVVCAHVNHKLRAESEDEAVMVKDFCDQNGIFFEFMTIDSYNNDNFHNDARTKRYDFFEKCVKKCQAKYLLTAHHGDDLMETILMRIVRGSTLKGYAGFSEKANSNGYTILRPLITYTKDEILNYVKENNIPYAVDKSNEKDVYTRNRFRKYILPPLKSEDKNVHKKFYKFNKTLELYDNYIDKQVTKIYPSIYKNKILNILKVKQLDEIIAIKIIHKMLQEIYQNDISLITDRHAELIYELICNKSSNKQISLPLNKKAIKSYNEFKIINYKEEKGYHLKLVDVITLPNNKIIEQITKTEDSSNYICKLNTEELKLPLYIRTRKTGDKMTVKGLNGTKKIKDIFIDEKIPKEERELWPIVVDSTDKIVWLPGIKKTKFDKTNTEKYDIILKYH